MPVQKLTLAAADIYVQDNCEQVPIPTVVTAEMLDCVDGRSGKKLVIAVPGGGMGMLGKSLATINQLKNQYIADGNERRVRIMSQQLTFNRVRGFFWDHLKGMSCHTDDRDHGEHNHLACAGCGHLMALINNPRYGLGEYTEPFRDFAAELKIRFDQGDPKVIIRSFPGQHKEQAVLRIKGISHNGSVLSVRSTDGETSVFVVNEAPVFLLLARAAAVMYNEFERTFPDLGVTKTRFIDMMRGTYHHQTDLSLYSLARGLPVFDVREQANGSLEVSRSNLNFN